MANWYVSSVKWTAVTAWASSTAYSIGDLRRQNTTPTVGNERVFRCTTAGTSGGSEPTWTVTKGGTTSDGSVVWTEVTGQAIYNGDGGGSAWAAPHARLASALATNWAAAGDTIFVDGGASGVNPHAETQTTAINLIFSATPASPQAIYCVDNAAVPPTTLATTASIASTGTGTVNISSGFARIYGVAFNSGSTSSSITPTLISTATLPSDIILEKCKLNLLSTASTSSIQIGPTAAASLYFTNLRLIDCDITFSSTSQRLTPGCANTQIIGGNVAKTGSVPTSLFIPVRLSPQILVKNCDLTLITGNLVNNSSAQGGSIIFQNCSVANGVTFLTGSLTSNDRLTVIADNCDSAGTNYMEIKGNYSGTLTQETSIVVSGGATDGTTTHSWKIVTGSGCNHVETFICKELAAWNETTGSITASIEVTCNTQLTDADIWTVFEYSSDASTSKYSYATTEITNRLGSTSNLSSGAVTWNNALTYSQKMEATFTVQQKGFLRAFVFVAIPSTTMYIEPVIRIAGTISGKQAQIPGDNMVISMPAGGGGLLVHPGFDGGMNG